MRGSMGRAAVTLLLAASAACGGDGEDNRFVVDPIVNSGEHIRFLVVNGVQRSYRVYVPPSVDVNEPTPAILVLHGNPPVDMAVVTGMNQVADSLDFLAVYPTSAQGGPWAMACDRCDINAFNGVDDLRYFDLMLESLSETVAVDPDRISVAGFSNGGMMTFRLACDRSGRFAAFAPVGAGMWEWHTERCDPSRDVPILMINGTDDPSFPWEGVEFPILDFTVRQIPVVEHAAFWAEANGCSAEPEVEELPDRYDDETTVDLWRYRGCGAPTRFYRIEGGGHTWPDMPVDFGARLGTKSLELNASRVIADFFLAQRR